MAVRAATPPKPSILDKLIGDLARTHGDGSRETLPCFVPRLDRFDEGEMRACVLRDVGWLLNDVHFEAAVALERFPEVQTSILNHGLPELTGKSIDKPGLARRAIDIAAAIAAYEPRFAEGSVEVLLEEGPVAEENRLRFVVHGTLDSAIDDGFIALYTAVDLDTGNVAVSA